jgi:hypothetical protein
MNVHGDRLRRHHNAIDARDAVGEDEYSTFFRFAFVRNPWDRAVSFYFSYINAGFNNVRSGGLRRVGNIRNIMESFHKKSIENKDSNFESWLISVKEAYDKGYNIHEFNDNFISEYCPIGAPINQLDFIRDENKKIIVDFIGRYENLLNDWEVVCNKLNFKNSTLAKFNSRNDNSGYTTYYNDNLIKIISELYEEEISFFDYKYGS